MARFQAQKKKQGATPQAKQKEDKKVIFNAPGDEEDDDDDDLDDEDIDDSGDEMVIGQGGAAVDEDDDDDDDEEDDDEEDDDDDDDEMEAEAKPRGANNKASPNKKTPAKGQTPKATPGKTPKGGKQTPAKQTPKNQKAAAKQKQTPKLSPNKKRGMEDDNGDNVESKKQKIDETSELFLPQLERLRARDLRSLFIKGLTGDVTAQDLKGLSSDIIDVRRKGNKAPFAFLEFKSEEMAEKNMALLQNKKLKTCTLIVDYVGEKSQNLKIKKTPRSAVINKLKLYVGGLPEGTTSDDLKRAFPKATNCIIPAGRRTNKNQKSRGFGFVSFANEAQAAEAYNNAANTVINSKLVTVLYAKPEAGKQAKAKSPKQAKDKKAGQKKGPKKDAKNEEGSDDDDEAEDDDDEEDDEEDDDDEESE